MKNTTEKINTLKGFLNSNCEDGDGGTISFNLKKPQYETGFYVAITNNTEGTTDLKIKRVLDIKESCFKKSKNCFLGYWKDNGILYIDFSLYVKDLNTALNLGRAFNQKAIYNIEGKNCINCY